MVYQAKQLRPAVLPFRTHFATSADAMSLSDQMEAWLERANTQYALQGNCSIGRAALNTLVLDSPKVSRLHSIIHLEDNGSFWLIDLGSSNGTLLNKRRINEPVRLRDLDEIGIGGQTFIFRQPHGKSSGEFKTGALVTLQEVENVSCWLLVADIRDFTALSRAMDSAELAHLVSSWLASCKQIIERQRGTINKYLGDGILAYWRDDGRAGEDVVASINGLKAAQMRSAPAFRFVIHFGTVALGGVPSTREETLMGSEVNLIFRLEKVLAALAEPCGITESAKAKLAQTIGCRLLGEYELKGFEGKRALFAI